MSELTTMRVGIKTHTQFFRLVNEVVSTFCRVVEDLPFTLGRSLRVISFHSLNLTWFSINSHFNLSNNSILDWTEERREEYSVIWGSIRLAGNHLFADIPSPSITGKRLMMFFYTSNTLIAMYSSHFFVGNCMLKLKRTTVSFFGVNWP